MLKPETRLTIPKQTKIVARAAFPKGSLFMKLRDELGFLFSDRLFTGLFSATGQPAQSPGRLAMVTIMQFAENLTDRQAADAVRGRIDWKYALGLELTDPGFHYSVLSEFRQRLVEGQQETLLLEKLLEQCEAKGLLKGKKKQRTDSTHVLAAIRALNLVELVGKVMRKVLNDIARIAPDWLQTQMQPEWIERYGRRFDSYRLPKTKEKREELACTIGADGFQLLAAIYSGKAPEKVRKLPRIDNMRQIWVQQYYVSEGKIHWRTKKQWGQPAAGKMIASPEDLDAKYCVKRQTEWTGYKVHLTETCEVEHPRLITQVATTPSTIHDVKMTETIQDDLIERDLKPEIQLVDEGYIETDLLVSSQNKGIDLVGPIPSSKSWQDRDEKAFDHTQFHIDWEKLEATCPKGKKSVHCTNRKTWRGSLNLLFSFSKTDCLPCELRSRCSRAKNCGRTLTIYPQLEYETLLRARQRQETNEFKALYGVRAGIEGTISQGTRRVGLRKSRYIGLGKTHLQNVVLAAAINMMRIFDWLNGIRPKPTPKSPFQVLAAQLA